MVELPRAVGQHAARVEPPGIRVDADRDGPARRQGLGQQGLVPAISRDGVRPRDVFVARDAGANPGGLEPAAAAGAVQVAGLGAGAAVGEGVGGLGLEAARPRDYS